MVVVVVVVVRVVVVVVVVCVRVWRWRAGGGWRGHWVSNLVRDLTETRLGLSQVTVHLPAGETVTLLHPPLPVAGASMWMERGGQ